ncbi:hypothetical protein DM02DRAFT_675184 [Periconia macrospinosa]|uniref:DUF1989 domain-containing protein n=1 Tax=Periconia macrospinosa TaxID=97972 RepID=A0A2V1DFG7_9PLEO|nr:hypothetical protein DM02DRAFT_675184 [Periconia macrospinosa]
MSTSPDPSRLSPIPPKAPSPRSPPVAQLEDPPSPTHEPRHPPQQADDPAFGDDDEIPYPEPGSEHTLLPPPNFNPFFTIVEDSTTGEHHHPFVHYVFADDDPAIVTAAAMRSMGLDDTKFLPRPEGAEREESDEEGQGQEHESVIESPLPPPLIGGKEHYLLIDVGNDGHTIVNAQSMSPDWQITKTNVRTAPSFDQSEPNQGYMLQIEGVQIPGKNKGKAKGQPGEMKLKDAQEKSHGDIFAALDGLVASVDGGLEMAHKISKRHEAIVKLAPSKLTLPNRRAVASLALVTALSALEKQRKARSDSVVDPDPLQESFAAQDMSGELQTIPARHGVATYVPKGRTIKIINTYGKQVVSAWAFGLGPPPEDGDEEEVEGEEDVEGMEEDVEKLKEGLDKGKEKEVEDVEKKIKEEIEKPKEEAAKDADEKTEEVKDDGKESKDETGETGDSAVKHDPDASEEKDAKKSEDSTNDADDPPEQAPDTPENEKSAPEQAASSAKSNQKRSWASYLPSIPYRNKNPTQGKADSNSKQESKAEKEKSEATSKKWSSYLPTGKGFSSYVPNVQMPDSQQVISAFQASHGRDPNKSYAEQLYDFSKTPVGAGSIAAATGSGTASSLYAAYSAYTKLNANRNDLPPMEYLSLPHTRVSTNRLVPHVNDTLLTNLRNPIITLIEDTSPGAHDTLTAACDASLYANLGVSKPAEHGSCAENLVLALKELNEKAGLKGTKAVGADITVNIAPTPLHLFMNAPISFDGESGGDAGAKEAKFTVQEPQGKKRSFVRFRAERDVVVVLSACPMDVGPQNGGKCMAANFMVEEADEDDMAASTASVKKAPRKLGRKEGGEKTETGKTDEKDKVAADGGGMPRLRGGPGKPAAVQKSAEHAKKSSTDDDINNNQTTKNDDNEDPPESEISSEQQQEKKKKDDDQNQQQHEEEPQKDGKKEEKETPAVEQPPKPKKKPKKLERRGAGTSTPSSSAGKSETS